MAKTLQQLKAEREKIDREIAAAEAKPGSAAPETEDEKGGDDLDERESDFKLAKDVSMVRFIPNHPMMARPRPNERNPRKMQRFFFYKRLTDDQIMCYTEAEADLMLKSSHAIILRQIGVSDGSAYSKFIRSCGVKSGAMIPLKKAQEILKGAMDAEMEAATGHYDDPDPQNVHFDDTIKRHKNARQIIETFSPPA